MLNKNSYLASLFLAPLILNKDDLRIIYLRNCLGTFYCDTNKPEWENKIIFAFKLRDAHSLKITEEIFNKHPYAYDKYIEHLNNTTYYIYAYTIPPHLKRDVDYLINGKYTKLSDTAKSLLRNSTTMSWLLNYYEAYFTKKVGMTFNTFHEAGILNLNKVPIKKGESNDSPFYFTFPHNFCLELYSRSSYKILHFCRNIIHTMNLFKRRKYFNSFIQ